MLLVTAHRQRVLHLNPAAAIDVYPSAFYNLFPPFPTTQRVFVAMPFSERFSLRWEYVIRPAVEAAELDPFRVDLSSTGDSIPLKILEELRTARLVFADITSDNGLRNANVMYELGIAHAIRRPEEVIVFRSDNERLPFDIAPLFADSYTPDGGPGAAERARDQVRTAIGRALAEVDLTRHLAVQRIVDVLDAQCFGFLAMSGIAPFRDSPQPRELGKLATDPQHLAGFSRLLTLGVLRTHLPDFIQIYESNHAGPVSEKLVFEFTPLGLAVAAEFGKRFYGGRTANDAFLDFMHAEIRRLTDMHQLSPKTAAELETRLLAGEYGKPADVRAAVEALASSSAGQRSPR